MKSSDSDNTWYSSPKMTWGMFSTTVKGLTGFVHEWEYVEFYVVVQERVLGIVGIGTLLME